MLYHHNYWSLRNSVVFLSTKVLQMTLTDFVKSNIFVPRKDNKKEDVKISKNVRFQEEVRTDEHKILINSNCDYEDEVFTLE